MTAPDDPVLVTGANGFTGARLCAALAARGVRVRALVRPGSDPGALDPTRIRNGEIQLVRGDVRDPASLSRAFEGVGGGYHVAALFRAARHAERMFHEVNAEGTRNVFEAAAAAGVSRLVHCSTIGVHGGLEWLPGNEDSPFAPSDAYQRSKLEGEKVVGEAIARGQAAVIVRPAGIYGPGDLRFLKLFRMVASGRFPMVGSGRVHLHLVYVDDLVSGMIAAMEHPEALGGTFILGGERAVELNELVRLVGEAVGRSRPLRPWRVPVAPAMALAALVEGVCRPFGVEPPLHRRRVAFFTKDRAFSIERARSTFGYEPQVPLEEGLARTAAWYREQGLLS